MELPFELSKRHKIVCKWNWKKRGVIFDGSFDKIYDIYIHASNCDKCGKKFKDSRDRCLDHDHLITDKFNIRDVLCQNCNTKVLQKCNNNTGHSHIFKIKSKSYKQGFCFKTLIERDGNVVIHKKRKTLEKAIECRDKFIKENPQYF